MTNLSKIKINKYIDHTIIKPGATHDDIKRYCLEVAKYDFHSVCVGPYWVKYAKKLLMRNKICSVAGFPLGFQTLKMKLLEVDELRKLGVDEIDVVANISMIVEGEYKKLAGNVKKIVETAAGLTLKVIIETPLLEKVMIEEITKVLIDSGAHFVKTGTGIHGPVRIKNIKVIAKIARGKIAIKAAGGIRSYKKALALINAGASRIGTSTGVKIVNAG